MRIAFIIGPFPSISQTFVLNQITGLIDLGHDVEIFARRTESNPDLVPEVASYDLMNKTTYFGEFAEDGEWYFSSLFWPTLRRYLFGICGKPVSFMRLLYRIKQARGGIPFNFMNRSIPFLGKKPYDVIHCHFGPNGLFAVLLREMGVIRGKIATVFHGYDLSSLIKMKGPKIYDELFEKGDIFLPISHFWADHLIRLGCPKAKIAVHRMGIDTNRFQAALHKQEPADPIKIISVARLVEKKGLEYGIRAVAEVVRDIPGIRYEIVGDGPLRNRLQDVIGRLGLQEKVVLKGWKPQNEVLEMLKTSDILLAPSITGQDGDQEGIPVIIMEGMATGLPVVSTLHSGIPELVQDGVSGFLVDEKDTIALSQRLCQLASDRATMQTMGHRGRQYVAEHFDARRLNLELSQLYQYMV